MRRLDSIRDRKLAAEIESNHVKTEQMLFHSSYVQAIYDTNSHRAKESQTSIYSDIARRVFAYAGTIAGYESIKPPKNFEEAMTRHIPRRRE